METANPQVSYRVRVAGIPRVRETAWLYGADRDIPLAHVRLEQRADDSGKWDLYLNDPAAGPTQHAEFPDEAAAREQLDRIYVEGRADGEWRISRPGGRSPNQDPPTPSDG